MSWLYQQTIFEPLREEEKMVMDDFFYTCLGLCRWRNAPHIIELNLNFSVASIYFI
jgi:hypothetical protein